MRQERGKYGNKKDQTTASSHKQKNKKPKTHKQINTNQISPNNNIRSSQAKLHHYSQCQTILQ